MPLSDSDPRVFFAAERTLLAWLRTALAVMGIGFLIARFGLFVQLIALQAPQAHLHTHAGLAAFIGILFVLLGALAAGVATVQHRRFVSTLPTRDLPPSYAGGFAVFFGTFMALLGVVLTVYLAITQP